MHNNVIKLKPPMVFNADDAHRLLAQLGTVMEDLPGALEAYHKLG
jgi:4-aminobutyrate aminotransferase-like enzyme